MLAKWTWILPLFIVRWLALRYCEVLQIDREGKVICAVAHKDVLFKLPKEQQHE